MKNEIIRESIISLRQEGLKFSIDTLADRLRISKKTVYKYFPDKETLALALYEKYFDNAAEQAEKLLNGCGRPARLSLLRLYYDAKVMTRGEIFNKYKLNGTIYAYVSERSNALWETVSSALGAASAEEGETLRIILDGTFEKLCTTQGDSEAVIERLADLL